MLKFILCDSSESDAVFIRRVIKLIAEKKEYIRQDSTASINLSLPPRADAIL